MWSKSIWSRGIELSDRGIQDWNSFFRLVSCSALLLVEQTVGPSAQMLIFKGPSHEIVLRLNYKKNHQSKNHQTLFYNLKPIYNVQNLKLKVEGVDPGSIGRMLALAQLKDYSTTVKTLLLDWLIFMCNKFFRSKTSKATHHGTIWASTKWFRTGNKQIL